MKTSLHILLFSFLIFGQMAYAQCDLADDFEDYAFNEIPTGWTVVNTTGETNNIYAKIQTSGQAPSPLNYVRMYNGNAATGDLIFVAPQVATTSDGNHRVKFWLQGTSTSQLELGTVDVNNNSATFSLATTFDLSNDWTYYEAVLPAGTNQYLAFRHNLGTTFDQVNIDSVCLEEIPTCLEVSNIALSNPSITTLDLTWSESGTGEDNWEYVVQEVGGGAPTTNGTMYTSTSATPSVTITDLVMDTEYEAYVRSDCGAGDYGAWILAAATGRTDCGLITENFCEDWDGIVDATVPFCWSVLDDPMTSGHAYVDYETFGYNKNMFELFFTSNTVAGDVVAISPNTSYAMDGNHRLNFTAGASTDAIDALEVGTIDTAGDFVLLTTITPTADRNQQYFVSLPNNDHVKFAFRHGGAINKYVWINTVCVEDTPSCLEVVDVNATNVQFDSADINWTVSGSNETTWEYLVQESSLPAPDATTNGTEIMATTVNVPLAQNTAYNAYVRAKCDTDDYGAWIASEEFTTACNIFVAEYSDSFEGLNEDGQELKPCWSIFDNTTGDFRTYATQNNIFPSDGNLLLRMFFSSASNAEGLFMSAPEVSDIGVDKQIRFKMNKSTSTTEEFDIIVGTMLDPMDPTTFVALDDTSLNETSIVAETWTEFTIDFTSYDTSLNHRFIAFKPQHSGNGSYFKNVYMDEYNYEFKDDLGFNDEAITAAEIITSTDYTCNNAITGDFVGATRSAEYPCTSPDYSDYKDLWYRFTPETTGAHAFALEDLSSQFINMFIFEGGSTNPIPIPTGCSTRYNTIDVVAGQTYFIAIGSDVPDAEFTLCVYALPETPGNDETTGAFELTASTDNSCNNAVSGTTASSTYSTDSACSPSSFDVWYYFVPDATANYTFRRDIIQGGGVTYLSVYEGTPGSLTPLTDNCSTYLETLDLTAGETYYVAISNSGTSIPVFFNLCVYPSPPAPANDECVDGFDLTVGVDFETSFIIGNNTSATRNVADPLVICDGLEFAEKGKDVWYTVVVPNSGRLKLETQFNDDPYLTDPGMQVYSGSCGALETIFCSNDQGQGFFNYIELVDMQPGIELLVRVWGRVGTFGSYKIAAYDDSDTCDFPSNIVVMDVLDTTATVSWDAPATVPAGGYQYIVQPEGSGYPGAANGTQTNDTQVALTGLDDNTAYEAYVKSLCSTIGSAWEGPITFMTDETLGLSNFDKNSFKLYPNPANGELNITSNEVVDTIVAYNMLGQKVQHYTINATSGQMDISELASGLYLFEVHVDNAKVSIKVVVN